MLYSLYWEEITEAWRERMNLLRKRDELSGKNQRLVNTIKNGQMQLEEARLENREYKRDLADVKKNIDLEKSRNIEDKKTSEKREAEIKRTQGTIQALN